ncbi:MAG: ATP-dependent Clp protease ATP-binding subunit [Clostridia bacterium]
MRICDICKKNIAVIFVTKATDEKRINQGICMECAQKNGIEPLTHLMKQSGMTEEDMNNINKQMTEIMNNMDIDEFVLPNSDQDENEIDKNANPFINTFKNMFQPRNEDDAIGKEQKRLVKTREKKGDKKKKYLDSFGINLNEKAKEGKIDRIIGREAEIERTMQILNRRNKNNPCLIGEPGVGKTAIAEGLALKIINEDVPAKLLNYEIYQLDMTGIVAGTQFRGQFESRMKGIIKEASDLGNIILVIDEVHNIMGAGEAEGAMNAANILKPALARGEVQVIGATTIKDYRKYIEKDSALERRFQPVIVEESSVEDTIAILVGIKDYYEKYHRVFFSDYTLRMAAILSERYINDRFLPDKAIDVIDEAASRVNLKNEALVKLQLVKNELMNVQQEKENAVSADSMEDYQKAAELKITECRLLSEIEELEKKNRPKEVTVDDLASVIESWTKIPVQKITEIESEKLLHLEESLAKRIIGQKNAISAVSRAIRRNRSGIRNRRRPASFVFVGPTGVGKTELVKALATELFESEHAIVRLDMSEYMEKHTVAKLIGSPPGYIGYDEGGQLTEKVRRNPYSIILFDEIEKAHPDVLNIMLQILEDGRLTDSHGRVVSFENTILIMTSNSGTSYKTGDFGFTSESSQNEQQNIKDSLKEIFRPEFLNRVDEIVVFSFLTQTELKDIALLLIRQFQEDLKEKSIVLDITDSAVDYLVKKESNEKFGARPLRRAIQNCIEDILSEKYIRQELTDGMKITIIETPEGLDYITE